MIFLSVLALTAMMNPQDAAKPALTCSVLGGAATDGGPAVDYNGVRYALCCAMCQATFQKDPAAAINGDKAKGKTIGTFMFDPIRMRELQMLRQKLGPTIRVFATSSQLPTRKRLLRLRRPSTRPFLPRRRCSAQ